MITTCAYCGVGCSFKAEMQGTEVVRMVPYKDGKANHGHSCVKGRFAWGYATHKDRMLKPMVRAKITDPWREVTWEEAISHAASEFKRIQAKYGRDSIGGITSSRCTNEETYLVQKMVRAAFGNNNVDTCARVCHSPTGYGLEDHVRHFGRNAGFRFGGASRRDHDHRREPDRCASRVCFADEAPAARGRAIDHRRPAPDRPGEIAARPGRLSSAAAPGTNVAMINALAHVVVTEGLLAEEYIKERCDLAAFELWRKFIAEERNSPEATEGSRPVFRQPMFARAARLYATGGNAAIYYGLGVTEHSQGSTMVMGMANLAMVTGNIGKRGVGVNPLRGQNNVQGSCDMGSFPHEFPGYRHVSDDAVRQMFEEAWSVTSPRRAWAAHLQHDRCGDGRDVQRPLHPG